MMFYLDWPLSLDDAIHQQHDARCYGGEDSDERKQNA
jgi:hypothetical protein